MAAEGISVDFLGEVADAEDDAWDLAILWQSDLDGTIGTASADAAGVVSMSTMALSQGVHSISLSATDSEGETCTAAVSISINGQPTAPEVVIEPGPAWTIDDLTAVVVTPSTDPEGDAISYTYAWSVDGTPVAITDTTIPASGTTKGEVWTVTVTPSDGLSAGASASASREISNSPPEVDSVSLAPDPAYTLDTLTATLSVSDADGDPVTATYTWTVNGLTVSETGSSLSGVDFFDKHDEVGLTVTPTDTEEDGDSLSATPIVILNTPPEAPEVTIEPEDPAAGIDALECVIVTESYDADEDEVTYTTEWTVDGVSYTGPFGVSELVELWSSSETPRTGAGYGVDWGDFDHDGDLDLAVANVGGVNHVYRNDGSTFTMVWSSPESDNNMSAAWADWNNDGNLDVAFGGYWGSPTRIYEGDRSTFTLAWTSSSAAEVWDLSWGNLNGDDLPDLAITHETGANRVYENTGGGFDIVWEASDSAGTLGMAWGDWDGDGDDDLAIGNQKACGTCSPGHPDQVYQNDGGTLSLAWTAGHADGTYSLAWGDWDGDGDLDLATAGNQGSTLRIYENVGGDLVDALDLDPGNTSGVDWGDWDGDGDDDLLSLTEGSAVLWESDGSILTEMWSDASSHWGTGAMADMDGDGDVDLVASSGSGQPTTVWENLYCEDCVPGSETSTGEEWTCTVTPDDGEEEGPPGTASVTIADPCLVASYDFDEGSGSVAFDGSGNGLDGSIVGAVWTTGISGGALDFTDGSSWVDLGNDALFDIEDELCIEAWVWVSSTTADHQVVLGKWFDSGAMHRTYLMELAPNGEDLQMPIGGGISPDGVPGPPYITADPVPWGDWVHVVSTYDGSRVRIYIDGVLSTSFAALASGPIPVTPASVFIGAHDASGDRNGFNGVIDEVRLYCRTLSSGEVADHAGVPLSGPLYRWAYAGTRDVEMVYGSCASTESYTATCEAALVGEQLFINESGGAALERKALGEVHMGVEPGARGHTVSLSTDELDITWSGATSCGGDWVRTDVVDVYECIAE